jgi:hypothetical protein
MPVENNQSLPLPTKLVNFPVGRHLEVKQRYNSNLQKVKNETSIEELISELAAYRTATELNLPYSIVLETMG